MKISDINLLSTVKIGPYELKNRVAMSAMTRCRTGQNNVPNEMNVTYYAQRASAGLIMTEATQISPQGIGYMNTPGIHTPEQTMGWKPVTDAVHEKGGIIFLQLMHCGRVSHPLLMEGGESPVAPSSIILEGEVYTPKGKLPYEVPRALETDEIPAIVNDYRNASRFALDAGFDGVEVHAANGYLPNQFLESGSNQRTDRYGGTIQNRARFVLEVIDAVTGICGQDRVGLHISPCNPFNSMNDADPEETYQYLVNEVNAFELAYLNAVEIDLSEPGAYDMPNFNAALNYITFELKKIFSGTYITNGGYDLESGNAVLSSGNADIVSYGRHILANPDLPERFARNAPLNEPDPNTFYLGEEKGYIDYPFL